MLTLSRRNEAGAPTLAAARELLVEPRRRDASLAALGAAALCAAGALSLAALVVLGSPVPQAKPTIYAAAIH